MWKLSFWPFNGLARFATGIDQSADKPQLLESLASIIVLKQHKVAGSLFWESLLTTIAINTDYKEPGGGCCWLHFEMLNIVAEVRPAINLAVDKQLTAQWVYLIMESNLLTAEVSPI